MFSISCSFVYELERWDGGREGERLKEGNRSSSPPPLLLLLPLLLQTVKQVFPTLDFLGWYSVGVDPSSLDLSLHTQVRSAPLLPLSQHLPLIHLLLFLSLPPQFITKNDAPLFLQLSPTPPAATSEATEESDLPLTIYETVLHVAPVVAGAEEETGAVGGAGVLFQKTGWKIETGEAERVAVDGVGKAGLEGGKGESSCE